ncbi:MAG: murein transglycosylase A [Plesiomonas sp.]
MLRFPLRVVLSATILAIGLVGCAQKTPQTEQSKPTRGQQYKDGLFTQPLLPVKQVNSSQTPVNAADFSRQVENIKFGSSSLHGKNAQTYADLYRWLDAGADPKKLAQFGVRPYQMSGGDNYGNVMFTGYYTPVLKARHRPEGIYRFPLYKLPKGNARFTREQIYNGALQGKGLELAYSASLLDNFMMEVQGSGYVDFENGEPLVYFGYSGKNGYGYTSIGKVLIEQGEVPREKMSLAAISEWVNTHTPAQARELFEQNRSYVYFTSRAATPVVGASGIPLVAKASVAADKRLIPAGSVLLAEIPELNTQGEWTGKHHLRLMLALDVGGAVKGNHFDIYHGVGDEAGREAGFYQHFGRVWVLKSPQDGLL